MDTSKIEEEINVNRMILYKILTEKQAKEEGNRIYEREQKRSKKIKEEEAKQIKL